MKLVSVRYIIGSGMRNVRTIAIRILSEQQAVLVWRTG
jgi:hypothetical protein